MAAQTISGVLKNLASPNWSNISWKNTMAVAAPLALSDTILQLGVTKQVNGESFIDHEFPYFDEIPPEVMSYLLGPVILAAVVFASATLFGKITKNPDGSRDDWKTAATKGAHLAFKMLLAVVGANLGEELVGEGVEGKLAVAALAGLGVVIAQILSNDAGAKRLWNATLGLDIKEWQFDIHEKDTFKQGKTYQIYAALFFAVVAASIFFSFSPDLGMSWGKAVEFENLHENDMGHAWLASTTTFVTAGASFGVLMPVLMPRDEKDIEISTPVQPLAQPPLTAESKTKAAGNTTPAGYTYGVYDSDLRSAAGSAKGSASSATTAVFSETGAAAANAQAGDSLLHRRDSDPPSPTPSL